MTDKVDRRLGNPTAGSWRPGQSGNPGGRRKEKPFTDEVLRLIREGNSAALTAIAKKLITCAKRGESWAIQLLYERIEGKTPQELKVTRDVREMSLDDILGELAEVRAAAGIAGEDAGAGESGSVH